MKYTTFRNLLMGGGVLGVGLIALWMADPASNPGPSKVHTPVITPPPPSPKAPTADHQAYLLRSLGKQAADEKVKDGLEGVGAKVNLYAEGGIWARAKVDLDRDDKWDEKWVIKDGVITKEVSSADDEQYDKTVTVQGAPVVAAPVPAATNPTAPVAAGALRAVDQAVMAALRGAVKDKVKDATRGTPYKVNLYSDDGKTFNRVKVDLDRDDKWDESWTVATDGSVERKVAPLDDEKYQEVWMLKGTAWTRK